MTINGVAGSTTAAGTQQTAADSVKTNQGNSSTLKPTSTLPTHDTVKLSGKALAKSLKQEGQNPAQIAKSMGIDVKTVDSYLGIQTTASAITPPPKPATPPAAAPATPPATTAAPAAKVDTKV